METLLQYKCPCCGGAIEFNSGVQKMKCPFCDTEFEMETLKELDEDLKKEVPDQMDWQTNADSSWQNAEDEGLRSYICQSCGGEVIGDETLAATACPYCGNPIVMMAQLRGQLKPDYVIPFKLDKTAAKGGFRKHLLNKRFLPKVFKDETHIDEIKGIYVPFWIFDADAKAHMRYKGTTVRTWSDSRFIYTETSYFSVVRGGNLSFRHVPVDGSTKMPDDLMESLEPYNWKDAVEFQTAYLAGYLADKYDVTAEDSIVRANQRIRQSTEEAFAKTVHGYASIIPEGSNIKLNSGTTKYALLPVWLMNTTWKGSRYTFAMNGQTGKFVGNLPIDKGTYHKWLWGLTGLVGGLIFAASYLIWLL